MRETPMAGCPGCHAPLIWTFAFSGHEFYCLECGRRVTFFGPVELSAAEHQGMSGDELTRAAGCMRPPGHRGGCRHRPELPPEPLRPIRTVLLAKWTPTSTLPRPTFP